MSESKALMVAHTQCEGDVQLQLELEDKMESLNRNMDPEVLSGAAFDAMFTVIGTKCPNIPLTDDYRRRLKDFYGDDQGEGEINYFKRWLRQQEEKAARPPKTKRARRALDANLDEDSE